MLQRHHLSPIPQLHIQDTLRGYSLPTSYLQFLQEEGAGYFVKSKIFTTEPTRFGLNFTLLNGIFGSQCHGDFWEIGDDRLAPEITHLPEYFVPFFKDEEVYYCFDYSSQPSEPSIRLIDREMDQWLTIATNFSEMCSQLQPHLETIDYEQREWITAHTLSQQLGQFSIANFAELLDIQEEQDLSELLNWIQDAHSDSTEVWNIAKEKFIFLDEFRHKELQLLPSYQVMKQLVKD